jgi:hypothetical protein
MDNKNDNFDSLWAQFRAAITDARTKYAADGMPPSVDGDNAFCETYAYVSTPYKDRTASLNVCATGAANIGASLQPEALVAIAGHCMAAAQVIMVRREANTEGHVEDAA